ncbi:MAG: hypothetical protein KatS3mg012_1187 [Gaiellaceae bacterium]|jgi:hypothetical protein|nr:MAG: hypothetical protein KatS3mg012_1187 [Gaiellaceae bacterium]
MEDFRVEATLADGERAHALQDDLRAATLGTEGLAGVMVTRDGRHVFLYADTEEQARRAEELVRRLAPAAEVALTRWHPLEEAWKDASLPLPRTPEEEAAELAAREAAEREEAAEEGDYDWHVVVHLPSRASAVELARALRDAGLSVRRRWRYLVVGALTEERAEELAERIATEHPEADARVEANLSDLERSPLQFLPF